MRSAASWGLVAQFPAPLKGRVPRPGVLKDLPAGASFLDSSFRVR